MRDFITQLLIATNNIFDHALPWIALILIMGGNIWFYLKGREKIQKSKATKSEIRTQILILLIIEAVLIVLFWFVPQLLAGKTPLIRYTLRWLIFSGIFLFVTYVYGHEYGERRWLVSSIGHIGILLTGWLIEKWVGIILISLPIFAIYYWEIYQHAMIIVPTANPEDRKERWKRFIVLAAYSWGMQFPIWVIKDHAWKNPEVRIRGDFTRDYAVPGIVWAQAHQVSAITAGTQFRRIDGPGLVFTRKLERPSQIVDLRLQLRTSEIDAISKDGVNFKARVFTAFRMDPEQWDEEIQKAVSKLNRPLGSAASPTYNLGSFHFSHQRIQTALQVTGSKIGPPETIIYWDQWVLNFVEKQARNILSQKMLDELWRPQEDKNLANGLDAISKELKEAVYLPLRAIGILIYAARVVNFRFVNVDGTPDDTIPHRQIASWSAERERKKARILANAQAEAEKMQQEARAYAETLLLNSIADGLQKAQSKKPDLPQYVVAMRIISSLENFIHQRPEESEAPTSDPKIAKLLAYIRSLRPSTDT